MSTNVGLSSSSGRRFNTLAQSGTVKIAEPSGKRPKVIKGIGSDLGDGEVMRKRAKKKAITQALMLNLIDIAQNKGRDSEHIQAYWNTWHCLRKLYSKDGKIHGDYCKNRFCPVCSGIRKAEIINKYLPVIQNWKEAHFLTLTAKSVPAAELDARMKQMNVAFIQIKDKFRKWHKKGKSIKLIGIKSLECNFNPIAKTYNPHFHIITPNKAIANILKQEWSIYWGYKVANPNQQHIQEIYNPEKCLIEIIKYGTKIFTDPLMEKSTSKETPQKKKVAPIIYVAAFDNIISAMKDQRIFDRFGFNLPKQNTKERSLQVAVNYEEWLHNPKQADWTNIEDSEQLLSGYVITKELLAILESNINTTIE